MLVFAEAARDQRTKKVRNCSSSAACFIPARTCSLVVAIRSTGSVCVCIYKYINVHNQPTRRTNRNKSQSFIFSRARRRPQMWGPNSIRIPFSFFGFLVLSFLCVLFDHHQQQHWQQQRGHQCSLSSSSMTERESANAAAVAFHSSIGPWPTTTTTSLLVEITFSASTATVLRAL